MKNTLLIFLIITLCLNCKQEKKTESEPTDEIAAIAFIQRSRYTIGDSIRLGFTENVTKVNFTFDGKVLLESQSVKDSFQLASPGIKTGWHQLVVSGINSKKLAFSDTIAVELISDLIPQEIKYSVLGQFPHLKTSFTEGLEFYRNELYEGTGENGKSQLLRIDLASGAALKSLALDQKYFGEGITIFKDKIYQLTWQSGVCFRYNTDFSLDKTFTYYFQGWGLTHNDSTLMMSDGSNKIHFYNIDFEKTGDLEVYDNTGPVRNVNELEYVDGFIYGNIFETNKIIRIDANTGKVVGTMDLTGIIPAEIDSRRDVPNGIAYQKTQDAFYVTGKNWPLMFKLRLQNTVRNKVVRLK